MRLPTRACIPARSERERQLMTPATIGRTINDQHRPCGRQIASEIAMVIDGDRIGR